MKNGDNMMRRVLAIDPGEKICGIAFSLNDVPIPYGCVPTPSLLDFVARFINEYSIGEIVMGGGGDPKTYSFVRNLSKELEKRIGLPVYIINEHYTTVSAHKILKNTYGSSRKIREKVDAVSASLILETYLKMQGK